MKSCSAACLFLFLIALASHLIFLSLKLQTGGNLSEQPQLTLVSLPQWEATAKQPLPNHEFSSSLCLLQNTTEPMPRIPTFIIAGAQKGGTSALYEILKKHPNIVASKTTEAHFFDRRGDLPLNPDNHDEESICRARNAYARMIFDMDEMKIDKAERLTFEKTPSYMVYPHIPALIKLICPWVKIIIVLRNPVDRLHSSYMGDDFDADLEKQVEELRRAGLIRAPSLRTFIAQEVKQQDMTFDITHRIRQTRNQKGKVAANGVFRGFYALQLAHWLPHFKLGSTLKVIRFEEFSASTDRQQQVLRDVLDFVGAPPHEFDEESLKFRYGPNNGPNRKQRKALTAETKSFLKHLYRPYNAELVGLLGEDWRDVWD